MFFLFRTLKKESDVKNAPKGSKRAGKKKGSKSPYARHEKTPYVYNKRAWREKWPHLASTIWDAQREGHNVQDLIHARDNRKSETRFRELEAAE